MKVKYLSIKDLRKLGFLDENQNLTDKNSNSSLKSLSSYAIADFLSSQKWAFDLLSVFLLLYA
jgi:hypothetical protein